MRRRFVKTFAFLIMAPVALSSPCAGDPIIGVWKTPPDRKDLVSHIEIRTCGNAFCARILRAYNSSGQQVQTSNIGKELFWDVKPMGDGTYDGGTAQIPLIGKAKASMKMIGARLQVIGCKAGICDSQFWSRP